MNLLERVKTLLKAPSPAVADLESARAEADMRVAEATAALARIEARRETVLLTGTLADLDKLDAEARNETFQRNQANAMAEELSRKLALAQEAANAAARETERARIEELMATAGKAMGAFPGHVAAIRKMLGAIAAADAAAEAFERKNPGEAPICRAEARVRFDYPAPRVLDERRVWAWVSLDGRIAARDNPNNVRPDEREPSNNSIRSTVSGDWGRNCLAEIEAGKHRPLAERIYRTNGGGGMRVWPEQVTRREIEEAALMPLDPLAEAIKLPPLRPGDHGWSSASASTFTVLAALDAPPEMLTPKTRIELVPDADAVRRADLPGPSRQQG